MYIKKKIAILGSTGSIGKTTLSIIEKNLKKFSIELLVCNSNLKDISLQIKKYSPKYVYINNLKTRFQIKKKKIKKKFIIIENLEEFLLGNKILFDKTVLGISSVDGIKYGFDFLKNSKEILIANKETIVCGGPLFIKLAQQYKCKITSIDLEHYTINELLKIFNLNQLDTIYLTASGGPFLGKKNFQKATILEVIKHPKWSMGKKISVDSSTMVNKLFEIIETHILFNIPLSKIKIKIHKESIAHSAIVLKNGLTFIAAHETSMVIPIRNSLFDNNFFEQNKNFFKSSINLNLSFNESYLQDYKILKTGYKIIKLGHTGWILFNAFNDILVNKFLNNEIFYYEIVETLIKMFKQKRVINYCQKEIKTIKDINNTLWYAQQILN